MCPSRQPKFSILIMLIVEVIDKEDTEEIRHSFEQPKQDTENSARKGQEDLIQSLYCCPIGNKNMFKPRKGQSNNGEGMVSSKQKRDYLLASTFVIFCEATPGGRRPSGSFTMRLGSPSWI